MDKHEEIEQLGKKFSEAIMAYTGSETAIIFYGYYDKEGWKYGATGKGDCYQRLGLLDQIHHDILIQND